MFIEKNTENILYSNKKHSEEEVLIEMVAKLTTETISDKGLFDNYDNADEVLKD